MLAVKVSIRQNHDIYIAAGAACVENGKRGNQRLIVWMWGNNQESTLRLVFVRHLGFSWGMRRARLAAQVKQG